MTQATDQRDFMDAMSVSRWTLNAHEAVPRSAINLACDLIHEEVNVELGDAIENYLMSRSTTDLVPVLDAIVDAHYVLNQLANTLGLPVDEAHEIVHAANMAKRHPDGTVRRREDGKVLKPAGWEPPEKKLEQLIHETIARHGSLSRIG